VAEPPHDVQAGAGSDRLLKRHAAPRVVRQLSRNYLLGFPSYLVATRVAFWSPDLSLGICAGLWVFWALTVHERLSVPARGDHAARQEPEPGDP